MQMKMAPDVFVAQARTKQQCRRVDSSAGSDDGFTSNADATTFPRASLYSRRNSAFNPNPIRAHSRNQSSSCRLRVGEPSLRAGLLRAERAAVATVATNFALVATHDVSRHGRHMPAQRVQTALQNLFARGNAIVVQIHGKARANRIQTARIFIACEPRHAGRGPFGADILRRSKRSAVIDDRAPAQAFSSKQPHALIRSRRKSAFQIQPLKACQLRAVEIRIVVVAPGLKHDNVLARSSQHSGRYAPAGTGTDDANVAGQIRIHFWSKRPEGAQTRLLRTERPGVTQFFPDRAGPSVHAR